MKRASNRVILGLSGGVDSAVAASVLMKEGYEVTGVVLTHKNMPADSAVRAANELGIELIEVDIGEALECHVCKEFERQYLSAMTPNPCIICNPCVKFPALIGAADRVGANYIATGHYARCEYNAGMDAWQLQKALSDNDQSYMLCRLPQEILSRCIFPLGGLVKSEVRKAADKHGLSAAGLPDSMEICFIPDGDHAKWITDRGGQSPPGYFYDTDGNTLGQHRGIIHYTIGMRRGLNVAAGERIYVIEINHNTNSIILGDVDHMYTKKTVISAVHWPSGELSETEFRACVKLRHSKTESPVTVFREGDGLMLMHDEMVRRGAPGQFAALYQDDTLICSGIICNQP